MGNFDFSVLILDYKMILFGIYTTIIISIISSILAFLLGSLFSYFRTHPQKIIKNKPYNILKTGRNMGCMDKQHIKISIKKAKRGVSSLRWGVLINYLVLTAHNFLTSLLNVSVTSLRVGNCC